MRDHPVVDIVHKQRLRLSPRLRCPGANAGKRRLPDKRLERAPARRDRG
jgi:hypothetical protein